MIRLRFVALIGAFAMLLGGYRTYVAYLRPAPDFVGATDAAHVAAVKALVAGLPAPAGTTLDPYGTWCDAAAAACWTSTTQQPKVLASALTKSLVAAGSRVRSHQCVKPEARPTPAPDGTCVAVLDYHGSRIDVVASSRGKPDNGGRTLLRLDSLLVTPSGSSTRGAPLDAWATVNPLPIAWTTGVTCVTPVDDGCRLYRQPGPSSPVIALPRARVCARVRAALRGRFFVGMDDDMHATPTAHGFCRIVAHRYRSLGGKDGEVVFVAGTSAGPTSTTLSVSIGSDG